MADELPKDRVDAVSYLGALSSLSLYLDKTGVEYHERKTLLDAEFNRAFDSFIGMLKGKKEEK